MTSEAVLVFLRAPEEGRVKTRLSKCLNPAFVLALYRGFVGDTLDALNAFEDKILYFWPPGKEKMLENWLGSGCVFSCQRGEDIGQRMANAFQDIFKKGYTRAILIGVDIPELGHDVIELAFKALQTRDAVIGPSADGGYYLIGFQKKSFSKDIFDDIDWSTEKVLNQSVRAMSRLSIQYELLPELSDIDTPEDLKALSDRVRKGGRAGRRTLKILNGNEA